MKTPSIIFSTQSRPIIIPDQPSNALKVKRNVTTDRNLGNTNNWSEVEEERRVLNNEVTINQ